VERGVESVGTVQVRMLGPLKIERDGVRLSLPASRKVRALFAYLGSGLINHSQKMMGCGNAYC
jgi:hypothetical protein